MNERPFADVDGIPFFGSGVTAGSAFLLDRSSTVTATEEGAGWAIETRGGSQHVVARGPGGRGYGLARDDSLDAANKGLDLLSVRGRGDYWIRDADDEHIVWWMDGPRAVVRALSVPTVRIEVGQVTVAGESRWSLHRQNGTKASGTFGCLRRPMTCSRLIATFIWRSSRSSTLLRHSG